MVLDLFMEQKLSLLKCVLAIHNCPYRFKARTFRHAGNFLKWTL